MKLVKSEYRRQGVLNFLPILSVKWDLSFAEIRIKDKSTLARFHKGFFCSPCGTRETGRFDTKSFRYKLKQ